MASKAKGGGSQQQSSSSSTKVSTTQRTTTTSQRTSSVPLGALKLNRYVPRYVKSGRLSETHEYDQVAERRGMIVRRGQRFFLDTEFSTPMDDYDLYAFRVVTTDFGQEQLQREWHLKQEPLRFLDDNSYDCPIQIRSIIHYPGSRKVTVVFYTAPNAITAKFWITRMYTERNPDEKYEFDMKFSVSVIYNAFHPDDAVYMENEKERDEYVLEDYGILYYGSSRKIGGKAWYFGNYDDPVLDCTYMLLAKSGLALEKWGDPVEVARTLSALVNSQDDNGVLAGNWSGDYSGGTSPLEWNSSLPIIKKYYETQEPVCYGQCWVFSGVMTALARSIGIPARSVTNFDSAHDTNCNLIIDKFYNDENKLLSDLSNDSIWNFHVWNDLWMRRPDLGEGFDGWQALDATPQEQSDGIFRTGPCPLKAIKEGRVDLQYDGPFLFAEVNACIKHWVQGADGSKKEIYSDPTSVGQFISTKAVGSSDRLDLTDQYKYPEGSREEEAAFRAARNTKKMGNAGDRTNDAKKRRNLQMSIVSEPFVVFGNDVLAKLEVGSGARVEKKVKVGLTVTLKRNNGKTIKQLAQHAAEVAVKPNAAETVELAIPASEYSKLAGNDLVGVEVVAVAVEGNERVVQQSIITVFNPDMYIEISGDVAQNKAFHFKCSFTNVLAFPLTGATFSIEGPGLRGKVQEQKVGTVKAGDTARCNITLTPLRPGDRRFIAAFNTNELKGVTVEYPVFVAPDPKAVVEDEIIPQNV